MITYYATTFFKPFFFEAALSGNLTTMLVMANIFISKMESLPNTSDIKMIDLWLILCQLVPFAQVVLLTAMEDLREVEQEKKKKEKQGKKKRKREKKMKGEGEKEEKRTQTSHYGSSLKSANDTTEKDLQLELEMEVGIEQDKPLEAWIPDHSNSTKTSLVRKLLVVGKYSTAASICACYYLFYFQRKKWCR